MTRLEHPELFTLRDNGSTHLVLAWNPETARALGITDPIGDDGRVYTSWRLEDPMPLPPRLRREGIAANN